MNLFLEKLICELKGCLKALVQVSASLCFCFLTFASVAMQIQVYDTLWLVM